jgi:hydroxymethylbilane synthase
LNMRNDVIIAPFRGNVDTRLKKLEAGDVQGIILAACGLQRLGLEKRITSMISVDDMLPSAAQGIIGLETVKKNEALAEMLGHISCAETMTVMTAERAMLEVLDGSCATPIGGLARIGEGFLELRGLVAHPDGKGVWRQTERASPMEAVELGREVGRKLRAQVPNGILPEG